MESQNSNAKVLVANKMTPRAGSGHSRGSGGSGGGPGVVARYSICLVLLNLVLAHPTAGQFFTKSASKSIPRMGRRSLPDYKSELEAYQQLLADEYEQNLINDALERQQKATIAAGDDGAEQVLDRNQKLSDLLKLHASGERLARSTGDAFDAAPMAMTRNERARPQLFGDLLAAAVQQQHQQREAAARSEATRERAW